MQYNNLVEILGELKQVEKNGKTLNVFLNGTYYFKSLPCNGLVFSYEKMGRKQVGHIIYMAQQLRRFTDKGHTINLFVKPEFRIDMYLPKAIKLSGREDFINVCLCDTPDLREARRDIGYDRGGKLKFLNAEDFNKIIKHKHLFKNGKEVTKFMLTCDMVWSINTQQEKDVAMNNLIAKHNIPNIYMPLELLDKVSSIKGEVPGDYSNVLVLKSVKI